MQKSEVVHTRVAPDLKKSVEAVLCQVGLSTSDAVTLFFRQIVLRNGLPFEVRIPNATTRLVLKEGIEGKNMKAYKAVSDLRRVVEGRPAKTRKVKC
ncbi:MAG: type II toxin-antitoxin system RelB/DinJ family antitoxin [Bdellovibrionales bacterium]|jgi:DNA-damage-inducible protein J